MYVLEPVPHTGAGLDWRRESGPMRERLHAFLEAGGYPTDIREELLVTPDDWRAQGMHLGTPFALAHTFLQSGPFRPSNVDRRVPGPGLRRLGHPARASASPWCSSAASSRPQRVQEYAGAARPVPRTVVR